MPHNIPQVIKDIEDVKGDLHDRLKRSARGSMNAVKQDAKANVKDDADWRGNLRRSISLDIDDRGDRIIASVHTDRGIAPYAPFVEFGTGARATISWVGSLGFQADEGSRVPPDFPYSSPSLGPGMVASIVEWVETKPVIPRSDDMTQEQLGFAIAATIAEEGTYAHPFLRPAWFQNEHLVKRGLDQAVRGAFR